MRRLLVVWTLIFLFATCNCKANAALKPVPSLTSESWGTIKNVLNYNFNECWNNPAPGLRDKPDIEVSTVRAARFKQDTYLVDGKSNISLTPDQSINTLVSNVGQGDEDVEMLLHTPDSYEYYISFNVGTSTYKRKWGVRVRPEDKLYLIEPGGKISIGELGGYLGMQEVQVGQEFFCWTFQTAIDKWEWKCQAGAIGTSTFSAQ